MDASEADVAGADTAGAGAAGVDDGAAGGETSRSMSFFKAFAHADADSSNDCGS